jgi:hypothetical protein
MSNDINFHFSDRGQLTAWLFSVVNPGLRTHYSKQVYNAFGNVERELTKEEQIIKEYLIAADFFRERFPVFEFKLEWVEEYAEGVLYDSEAKLQYYEFLYVALFRGGVVKSHYDKHPFKLWLQGQSQILQAQQYYEEKGYDTENTRESVRADDDVLTSSSKVAPDEPVEISEQEEVFDFRRPLWHENQSDFAAIMDAFFDLLVRSRYIDKRPTNKHYTLYFRFSDKDAVSTTRITAQGVSDARYKGANVPEYQVTKQTERVKSYLESFTAS